MSAAHAILSPSAAHRWLNCTPSARFELEFPDSESDAAEEGTLAHKLGELIIRQRLKLVTKKMYEKEFSEIQQHKFYDHAMLDHCEAYAVFVLERFADAQAHTKDAVIHLEHHLNLTDWIEEGFGTGDSIIIADTLLDITDLKYGKGVHVSAQDNPQMKLYALGALRDFEHIYGFEKVRMTIFQPRIDNYSSFEMTVEELKAWAESELKPKAALAFAGEGEFIPGTHCQFCRAKAVCKALADYNLELARHEFAPATVLTDEDIVDILNRSKLFEDWLSAVQEHALNEAVNNGKKWPGYKLVEGRSNRKYQDDALAAEKLIEAGYKPDDIFKTELLGITALEKVIGKKEFAFHLNDLIIKPPGKPALVPASDKRPEYSSAAKAAEDFAETITE